MNEDM